MIKKDFNVYFVGTYSFSEFEDGSYVVEVDQEDDRVTITGDSKNRVIELSLAKTKDLYDALGEMLTDVFDSENLSKHLRTLVKFDRTLKVALDGAAAGNMIEAIKLVREKFALPLQEAKRLVESYLRDAK